MATVPESLTPTYWVAEQCEMSSRKSASIFPTDFGMHARLTPGTFGPSDVDT